MWRSPAAFRLNRDKEMSRQRRGLSGTKVALFENRDTHEPVLEDQLLHGPAQTVHLISLISMRNSTKLFSRREA
jgi:hypothetical protein